jgi:hypothetical protein
MLSWGDQQIQESIDEVENFHAISYDKKRQVVVKRIRKKRRITIDSAVVITTKETLLDTRKSKVSELL